MPKVYEFVWRHLKWSHKALRSMLFVDCQMEKRKWPFLQMRSRDWKKRQMRHPYSLRVPKTDVRHR